MGGKVSMRKRPKSMGALLALIPNMEEDRAKRIRGSSLRSIRVRPMFAALLSTLFVCFAAFGHTVNSTTGSIPEKLSDHALAGLPGVTVTATNLYTGLTRT